MKTNSNEKISCNGYTIGDVVYIKPVDSNVLKGVVVDFQVGENKSPIVECKHPYKKNEKIKIVVSLDRISKTETIVIAEWKLVNTKYTYNGN
jgi:hypothetical protein